MVGIKVDLVGMEKVAGALKQAGENAEGALAVGLYRLGSAIIADSVRLAPKKFGVLRASAYCTLPTKDGEAVGVQLGYGGFAKAYAWVQHERTDFRHTEGGPKFLEKAIQGYQDRATGIVLDAIKQAIDSGHVPTVAPVFPSDPNAGPSPPKGKGSSGGGGRSSRSKRRR